MHESQTGWFRHRLIVKGKVIAGSKVRQKVRSGTAGRHKSGA
ncbi:hypothetical protein [Microbulbifer halophilus]